MSPPVSLSASRLGDPAPATAQRWGQWLAPPLRTAAAPPMGARRAAQEDRMRELLTRGLLAVLQPTPPGQGGGGRVSYSPDWSLFADGKALAQ